MPPNQHNRLPHFVRWYTLPVYGLVALGAGLEAREMFQQMGGLEEALNNVRFIYYSAGTVISSGAALVALLDAIYQIRKNKL